MKQGRAWTPFLPQTDLFGGASSLGEGILSTVHVHREDRRLVWLSRDGDRQLRDGTAGHRLRAARKSTWGAISRPRIIRNFYRICKTRVRTVFLSESMSCSLYGLAVGFATRKS